MRLYNFKGLAALLLRDAARFLVTWCPGGKIIGREYTAASIRGGVGESFKCNVETGAWADFAGNEKGGDLISLFATIEGLKPGEAARHLAKLVNYPLDADRPTQIIKREPQNIGIPPEGTIIPPMIHPKWGEPVATWCYRHPSQLPIYYEARYDTPEGKQYAPWSWDKTSGRWICKGFPAPRPLWGLDMLFRRAAAPVLIVEGPKCAEAATAIAGGVYVVTTWSNGAQAYAKADWTPLKGRDVLIWPDADEPGKNAAAGVAEILLSSAKSIKILNVDGVPDRWDAADAVAEGWDWAKFKEWATPRAVVVAIPEPMPEPEPELEPQGLAAQAMDLGLSQNGQGKAHCNLDNALRVLDRSPQFRDFVWFDEFYQRYFTTLGGPLREWSDAETLRLTLSLQREYGLSNLNDKVAWQAMSDYARRRTKNAPKDWMETLEWDGTKRINAFFWDCFGVPESEYSYAVGANFWIGMVARIYRPGCQLDNMVILEGVQGTRKTSSLRVIGGDWYTNAHDSIQSKDFFLSLQGKLIIEISEMESFSKAEIARIKQVVTSTTDRYRSPYERASEDHPRQSIFIGTTNERTYLKDHTGARRFWPLRIHKIDVDRIAADREQLFAEAVVRFKASETWWEMPESAAGEQERRRQSDAWEHEISNWLRTLVAREVTVAQVATECLKIEIGRLDPQLQARIGKALSIVGWEQCFPENVWREKLGLIERPGVNGVNGTGHVPASLEIAPGS